MRAQNKNVHSTEQLADVFTDAGENDLLAEATFSTEGLEFRPPWSIADNEKSTVWQ
jgi:hypothetical protein